MDLLQVLVDQVHVVLIENDVDQPEEFDLFVGVNQLRVLIVDVLLELGVEVGFYNRLVI